MVTFPRISDSLGNTDVQHKMEFFEPRSVSFVCLKYTRKRRIIVFPQVYSSLSKIRNAVNVTRTRDSTRSYYDDAN